MNQHTRHTRNARHARSPLLAALLVSGSLAISTACGTPSGSGAEGAGEGAAVMDGAVQHITVNTGNSMAFTPARMSVAAGMPVEVTLRNGGVLPHDITVTEGVAQPVRVEAAPGQTVRGTFTIEKPGTYTFICGVPGHAAGGMRGTITVR